MQIIQIGQFSNRKLSNLGVMLFYSSSDSSLKNSIIDKGTLQALKYYLFLKPFLDRVKDV